MPFCRSSFAPCLYCILNFHFDGTHLFFVMFKAFGQSIPLGENVLLYFAILKCLHRLHNACPESSSSHLICSRQLQQSFQNLKDQQ